MPTVVDTAISLVQRRSLKRHASHEETGILPLSQIRTSIAFLDVEDTSFDLCKNRIMAFWREHDIHGEIFFLDFRKLSEGERLITSINTTILRKDLNWFGRPGDDKIRLLNARQPDLLISTIREKNFAYEFLVTASNARFKIGRKQLPGRVFDVVLLEKDDKVLSEADAFANMARLMERFQ